ncbi:C40 family peptidase [Comamonadaceae bacterium M7527]|nr:C40 family peptidase [Comamonadaceae bacterium M7527]
MLPPRHLRTARLALPKPVWTLVLVWAAVGHAVAAPYSHATEPDSIAQFLVTKGLVHPIDSLRERTNALSSQLAINAMGLIGVPYVWGGSQTSKGLDCSGLVQAVYKQASGVVLPRNASQQAAAAMPIDNSELRPGDLVFFNTLKRAFSHVGIYVGDGKFVHAPKPGAVVRIEDMTKRFWQRRFEGARRVDLSNAPLASSVTNTP